MHASVAISRSAALAIAALLDAWQREQAQCSLAFSAFGELRSGLTIDNAIDALYGPVFYRALVTGKPIPRTFTDALGEIDSLSFGWRRKAVKQSR